MAEKQVVARMFFKNGHTEMRPLSWVQFTSVDTFSRQSSVELAKSIDEKVKTGEDEVYIAFTDQLQGIQIFLGEFVNARLERSKARGAY
jgi:hypothetical protein